MRDCFANARNDSHEIFSSVTSVTSVVQSFFCFSTGSFLSLPKRLQSHPRILRYVQKQPHYPVFNHLDIQ